MYFLLMTFFSCNVYPTRCKNLKKNLFFTNNTNVLNFKTIGEYMEENLNLSKNVEKLTGELKYLKFHTDLKEKEILNLNLNIISEKRLNTLLLEQYKTDLKRLKYEFRIFKDENYLMFNNFRFNTLTNFAKMYHDKLESSLNKYDILKNEYYKNLMIIEKHEAFLVDYTYDEYLKKKSGNDFIKNLQDSENIIKFYITLNMFYKNRISPKYNNVDDNFIKKFNFFDESENYASLTYSQWNKILILYIMNVTSNKYNCDKVLVENFVDMFNDNDGNSESESKKMEKKILKSVKTVLNVESKNDDLDVTTDIFTEILRLTYQQMKEIIVGSLIFSIFPGFYCLHKKRRM